MNVFRSEGVETTRALLQNSASPHQTDSSGATPLHIAATCLHPEIVRLLLDARADQHAMDHAGLTPWMLVGELRQVVGSMEKSHIQDLLNELDPVGFPADVLDLMEKNWEHFRRGQLQRS